MSKNAVIELIRDAMGDGFESFCMCLKRVRPVHVQPRPDASGYNYDIAHHLDRLGCPLVPPDGGDSHVVTQRDGFAATFKDVELLRETIDAVGVDVVRGWLYDCVPVPLQSSPEVREATSSEVVAWFRETLGDNFDKFVKWAATGESEVICSTVVHTRRAFVVNRIGRALTRKTPRVEVELAVCSSSPMTKRVNKTIDTVGAATVLGWLKSDRLSNAPNEQSEGAKVSSEFVADVVGVGRQARAAQLAAEIAEKQAELDKLRKLAEASERPTRHSGVPYVDNLRNLVNWLELIEAEAGDYAIDDEGKTCLSSDDTRGVDKESAQLIADLIEAGELPWF